MKKNEGFSLSPDAKTVFQSIKSIITSVTMLTHLNLNLITQFILLTDASRTAIKGISKTKSQRRRYASDISF